MVYHTSSLYSSWRPAMGTKTNKRHEDTTDQTLGGASTATRLSGSSILIASALTRDLSDLSGSYVNGNTAPRRKKEHSCVPGDIFSTSDTVQSALSYHGPWRQAQILSTPPPIQESYSWEQQQQQITMSETEEETTIMVARNGVVEVIQEKKEDIEEPSSPIENNDDKSHQQQHQQNQRQNEYGGAFAAAAAVAAAVSSPFHPRIPLVILLMDPAKKIFELMQIWVDPLTDTVRDVLHALQKKLSEKTSEKWRQDYDGLFQCRGNQFSQLIHILNVAKYDLRSYEIWVAKPWSMSATTTMEHATELLRRMRSLGVLSPSLSEDTSRFKLSKSKGDDTPITLSAEARRRIYAPGGIMNHHHASQFLTFFPPFDAAPRIILQVGSTDIDESFSSVQGFQRAAENKYTFTKISRVSTPPSSSWSKTKRGVMQQPKSVEDDLNKPDQPYQPSQAAPAISTAQTEQQIPSKNTAPGPSNIPRVNESAPIHSSSSSVIPSPTPASQESFSTKTTSTNPTRRKPRKLIRLLFSCFGGQSTNAGDSITTSSKSELVSSSAKSDWEGFRGPDDYSVASHSIVSDSAPLLLRQHKQQNETNQRQQQLEELLEHQRLSVSKSNRIRISV